MTDPQPTGPVRPVPVVLDAEATTEELLARARQDYLGAQGNRDAHHHEDRVQPWQIGDPT